MCQLRPSISSPVFMALHALVMAGVVTGCSDSSGGAKAAAMGGSSNISAGGSPSTGGASAHAGASGNETSGGGGASTSSSAPIATGGAGISTGGTQAAGGTMAGSGGTSGNPTAGGSSPGGTSATGGRTSATGGGTSATGGMTSVGTGGSSAPANGAVRWVGRVLPVDSTSARFAWQGAGLIANVMGSTIAVKLRTEGTSSVYFQPVVDHNALPRFNVDQGADRTVTIATGLGSGEHLVELYRETEGYYGMSTFLGFTSGTVTGAPAANGRLLEVVGDSISAGYGNLGSEPHPNWVANPACHWTAENSSWYATYAAVAGHALGAEVSTIARSGAGMVRDNTNDPNNVLPKFYPNALGQTDNTPWSFGAKASAVVINLGTNDWANGDPGTSYETAYVQFIAQIRGHYPNAWIFLVIGSMLDDPQLTQVKDRLASVVAKVQTNTGDTKLATFDLGVQNMGSDGLVPTGCDWHPNVADHARMAGILQAQLTTTLGWQP